MEPTTFESIVAVIMMVFLRHADVLIAGALLAAFVLSLQASTWFGTWTVERVIDGDTLLVRRGRRRLRVRLLGVDSPESVHPRIRKKQHLSEETAACLRRLIQGRRVYLQHDRGEVKQDLYGRTLAYVLRASDGLDVGEELIRLGLAKVYRQFPCGRRRVLEAAEAAARSQRRGLWRPFWWRPLQAMWVWAFGYAAPLKRRLTVAMMLVFLLSGGMAIALHKPTRIAVLACLRGWDTAWSWPLVAQSPHRHLSPA